MSLTFKIYVKSVKESIEDDGKLTEWGFCDKPL